MFWLLSLKIFGYVCVFLGFCLLAWAKVLWHREMHAESSSGQYAIIKQDEIV